MYIQCYLIIFMNLLAMEVRQYYKHATPYFFVRVSYYIRHAIDGYIVRNGSSMALFTYI